MSHADWLAQTINQVLARYAAEEGLPIAASCSPSAAALRAQSHWCGAIAALDRLLERSLPADTREAGLILAAPTPVLSRPELLARLHAGTFAPQALAQLMRRPFKLPAASESTTTAMIAEYPLFPVDPLASEQFCFVLTAQFSLVLAVGEDANGDSQFRFEFAPEAVAQVWQVLRSRLQLTSPHHLPTLDAYYADYPPVAPDYRLVTAFSRDLLVLQSAISAPRPETAPRQGLPNVTGTTAASATALETVGEELNAELELLQALTHEIRTPLTTIRMLTRLLLKKRCNLTGDAIERLESIDQECTEQINRMELIFRAVELETRSPASETVPLAPIALQQLIQQSIPQWQKQAQRRNVTLNVLMPDQLPTVVSNPGMLDKALMGLMESLTRSLPLGGQIQMQVTTAGHQLKLQLRSAEAAFASAQALGQLLMFQPETGSLSLNLDVTKNLFHAMGGKLTVRQHPCQGEVLTIFLPLGNKITVA